MTSEPDPHRSATLARLRAIAADLSGCSADELTESAGFLQLGFDSLFMTQLANTYQQAFGIDLSFRQLIEEHSSLGALADYITSQQPAPKSIEHPGQASQALATTAAPRSAAQVGASASGPIAVAASMPPSSATTTGADGAVLLESVIQGQIELMNLQLDQLRRLTGASAHLAAAPGATGATGVTSEPAKSAETAAGRTSAGNATAPDALPGAADDCAAPLGIAQRHHLDRLVARCRAHAPTSARQAIASSPPPSPLLEGLPADAAAAWREMDFPIVVGRSLGAHIWDADDNRYIDLALDRGTQLFGHAPDIVSNGIRRCVGKDAESLVELVSGSTQLLQGLTGLDHVIWMRSASQAMTAAIALARRRTGRPRITRLGRGTLGVDAGAKVFPSAAASDELIMPSGSEDSLSEIRRRADEIAAVVVDAMDDDLPDADARAFLQRLRMVATDCGILLILDERVSGFRLHPAGAQGYFDIRADLAVYGGLLGTVQPLGALAGAQPLVEDGDEAAWPVGGFRPGAIGADTESDAGVGMLLSMSCVQAMLDHLKTQGPSLQERLAQSAARLCDGLRQCFAAQGAPLRASCRGSQVRLHLGDAPLAPLLFWHLRVRGVHATPGAPLYLSSAHTDEDIDLVLKAFEDSIHDMQDEGVIARAPSAGPSSWRRVVPMTSAQRELFFAAQLGDIASCAYNESDAIRITGPLDAALLCEVVSATLARHEAFRMRFDAFGETQMVDPDARFPVQQADLSQLDSQKAEAELSAVVSEEALMPFDLQAGPLARVRLIRMPGNAHVLLMYFHHIAFDGYSGQLVMDEIASAYNARRRGLQPEPSRLPPYSVFVYRHQAQSDKALTNRSLAWWQSQFANHPPRPLELPTDRPRGPVRQPSAATVHRDLGPEVLQAVKALAKAQGITLFAALLAAFEALLGRLARQDDVIVAIPAAGQAHLGLDIVGYCVTALPVRAQPGNAKSFAQHARETQRAVLDALDHQDASLGAIIRALRLPGSRARLPLAEVMFNFSGFLSKLQIDDCTVVAHENSRRAMFYDMFLHGVESDSRLILDWDYRTDLFDAATIEHWLDRYRDLLLAAARTPDLTIGVLATRQEADAAVS